MEISGPPGFVPNGFWGREGSPVAEGLLREVWVTLRKIHLLDPSATGDPSRPQKPFGTIPGGPDIYIARSARCVSRSIDPDAAVNVDVNTGCGV